MGSLYLEGVSGRGRDSGDSVSSGTQQTPSTTVSVPSMPDIFVWAPADETVELETRPQCAFDSTDPYFDFGLHQPKLQLRVEEEEEEVEVAQEREYEYEEAQDDEIDQVQIVPRKGGVVEETTNEPFLFTRESLLQDSPPPPPVPEKSKNLKFRATSFFKSFRRSNKNSNNDLSIEVPSRRASSQDLPSSDRNTIRTKRSILFNLTRRNKSTTALSRLSNESDLSLDPDPFSSTPPVPPIPAEYGSRVVNPILNPVLRRQGTEPTTLRSRANEWEPSPPLPPLPTFDSNFSISSPLIKPTFSQSAPPILDYFSTHKDFSDSLRLTSSPSCSHADNKRAASHTKLPSLHFDSLQFDISSF